MIKKIRHILEFIPVRILFCLFGLLPMSVASCIGGFLGRKIGPLFKVNKLARKNIAMALPDLNNNEIDRIITGMWDNLGRVCAEYPHLIKREGLLFEDVVEIDGLEHIEKAINNDIGNIFFSGHLANWEFIPKVLSERGCSEVRVVYRKANNPYVDKLILDIRNHYQSGSIPKGSVGARHLIKAIKDGQQVCMLVDQKQNDGIAVPFFNKEAMTAPAIATLALKYDCSLFPIQIIRKSGIKYKAKIFPKLNIKKTGDDKQDTLKIMSDINAVLEKWISENPEQWFWVHNRWPKE